MKIYVFACWDEYGDDKILELSTNKQDTVTSYNEVRENFIRDKREWWFDKNYHLDELEITEDTGIFWEAGE